MTASHRPDGSGDDAAHLRGLLPDAPEWDLTPARRRHHRDVLLREIDRARTVVPAPATPAPRRRWPRPVLLLPATAMALAGALIVTLPGTEQEPGARAEATDARHTAADGVVLTLDRIAAASMAVDVEPVRDDQFVYVRSLVRSNEGAFDGPVKLGAPHRREIWVSQDSAPVTRVGVIREYGQGVPMSGQRIPVETAAPDGSAGQGVPAGIDRPTYRWLAGLPTDTDALRELLYARTRPLDDESKDQAVFRKIGDLLNETVMPPASAAALYRTVATIPGVRVTPDATDAAGRHGIGITREETGTATRDEWIFDRNSFTLLGSRSYLTRTAGTEPSTLYNSTAILETGVVDRDDRVPANE
ncbi:CU044_5270 family protein [Streptomyces sp. S-9]|uniref:CU044_5270 family protein n=1 Tax=Streptomyces TaxID=1883 RepID=UPI00193C2608|nr:CU044_5270 family protein [Streptomyces sp. S-9]